MSDKNKSVDKEKSDKETSQKNKQSSSSSKSTTNLSSTISNNSSGRKKDNAERKDEKKIKNKVIYVKSPEEYENIYRNGLVIVDFNTSWCGPCRAFEKEFEKIAEKYDGVTFLSVNAEDIDHPHCSSVSSVPTFRIFLDGEMKREFSGVDKNRLIEYIERYNKSIKIFIGGKLQTSFNEDLKKQINEYMNK
jgi:thioredoxin 1